MGYSRFRITRATLNGHRNELMRPHMTNTDNPIDFPADAKEEYFSAEYVFELQREVARLKQQVAFLEDYRAVWAPVVRQHQGLEK